MQKIKFFLVLFCFSCFMLKMPVYAQQAYTTHVVVKGETLSAIAKKFHTTTAELMKINNLNSKSILKIGQKIKVPSAKPVVQTTPDETENVVITTHPIYHTVKSGETLYGLSKKYGSSVAQLKSWNKLSSDVIVDGKRLIIGFEADDIPPTEQVQTPPKVEDPTKQADTAATTITYVAVDTMVQKLAPDTIMAAAPIEPAKPLTLEELFFKNGAGKNLHVLSGNARTFEAKVTTSSPGNYILMNNLPAGTIVKITSSAGESIYAKVLWRLDAITPNEGLDFRISDTAAKALGITDTQFALAITYFE